MSDYTDRFYKAAMANLENLIGPDGIYHGVEGALRMAREYGRGLSLDEMDAAKSSYSCICVRVYLLKPPISAKDWIDEILKVMTPSKKGGAV